MQYNTDPSVSVQTDPGPPYLQSHFYLRVYHVGNYLTLRQSNDCRSLVAETTLHCPIRGRMICVTYVSIPCANFT